MQCLCRIFGAQHGLGNLAACRAKDRDRSLFDHNLGLGEFGGQALAIPALEIREDDQAFALGVAPVDRARSRKRSEEHTSELQSLMRISYAVFCLKKKKETQYLTTHNTHPVHTYKQVSCTST